ncbi:MAG: Uma2 family endonuclease, partial [Blastocatellia bacterium]
MSTSKAALATEPVQPIEYPSSDGKPMAETDIHRDLMAELIHELDTFFSDQPDVYVSGNLLVYYVEGNPKKRFAPDVFVVRGVGKHKRRTYKLWEEERVPEVVIELSSRQTWSEDLEKKYHLFKELGVKEYFLFDPEYDYLPNPLVGYRLVGNRYVHMKATDNRLISQTLGLELVDTGETLRLFNSKTGQFLPTRDEETQARRQAEQARRQAEQAQRQAEQAQRQAEQAQRQAERQHHMEAQARQNAEAELDRLREKMRLLGISEYRTRSACLNKG